MALNTFFDFAGKRGSTARSRTVDAPLGVRGRHAAPPAPGTLPHCDVLVLDAAMRQSLVATRSFGQAGLRVGLVEGITTAAPRHAVPAFSSRWAHARALVPDAEVDPDGFGRRVTDLVMADPGVVVLPCSDQSLASLRPWRSKIDQHGRLAIASEAALTDAVDKIRMLSLAEQLGIACPDTEIVDNPSGIVSALHRVGFPAVVKPASSWLRERAGSRLLCEEVVNEAEAIEVLVTLLDAGVIAYLQRWLSGRREAVSVVRADGKVVAAFGQVTYRTTPVLGGASVVRESVPLDPELHRAALALVEAMDLEGFAEVEFRRDDRGRPLLMEINPRLSGTIELAVRAGVDFPLLVWQWASGSPIRPVERYRTGLRMRWLTGDVRWLFETLRRPGRPDSLPRWRAVAAFAGSFARPSAYDFVDVGDPKPMLAELGRVAAKLRLRVTSRVAKTRVTEAAETERSQIPGQG